MGTHEFAIVVTTSPTRGQELMDANLFDGRETRLGEDAIEVIETWSDSHPGSLMVKYHNTALDVSLYLPGDFNVVSTTNRRKRLLVADMESTIIEQEMLDELADQVGLRERVADITERAMRGELDFEAAIDERVAMLAGLDANVLDELAATQLTYMDGARELVATMKANGAYCALVSGGFTHFTAKVAAELGFDEHRANTLEIADGKLTGRVVRPILGREAKLAALKGLTARLGLEPSETLAVGDGANDLALLKAAGLGVAFHAKPNLRDEMAIADNGAVVTHCDLTALLYLQGFTRSSFVTR